MGLVLGPEAVSKVLVGIWVPQGTRVVYPGKKRQALQGSCVALGARAGRGAGAWLKG